MNQTSSCLVVGPAFPILKGNRNHFRHKNKMLCNRLLKILEIACSICHNGGVEIVKETNWSNGVVWA